MHADQPSTAHRAELVSAGTFNKGRPRACSLFSLHLVRVISNAPFGRTRCTLTSRRLPCMLTSLHADHPFDREASFGRTRCTLTSRRLPGPFRTNKSYPPEETKCTLTSLSACSLTSRRLPCMLTSRRLPCTLTSRRLPLTSRRLPCMLTSRRLPCTPTSRRLPGPFRTNKSYPPKETKCKLTSRRLPCTLTSRRLPLTSRQLPCMLTSRRLPCTLTSLSAGTFISYASFPRPLSDEQELSPGRDLVHADQPSTACRADPVSAGSFN
ncbi:hypothetical protein DPMN_157593 [Dreissena polymorpha]|uniref:Uncharacterized protein n=1 Tax=Dreissena polymorpha TaxID=45954 RepID=A0A9D4EG97_DREPO|nr:hypothetical protein DPMN_157593 [Dreissena polymorpha]